MLIRTLGGVLALVVFGVPAAGQAPAPAAPATYMTQAELAATIKTGADARPEMATARVSNTDHYRINIVHRGAPAGAIVHQVGTEVHHITDGAGTLVTGGTIVRPAGGGPATVTGGVTRRVAKGDVILIPEGTPHWYRELEGSITYLEVRFNVPRE